MIDQALKLKIATGTLDDDGRPVYRETFQHFLAIPRVGEVVVLEGTPYTVDAIRWVGIVPRIYLGRVGE